MHGNADIARIVIAQNFQIGRYYLWMPHTVGYPWNLPAMLQLISDHRDKAAALAPKMFEFELVKARGMPKR